MNAYVTEILVKSRMADALAAAERGRLVRATRRDRREFSRQLEEADARRLGAASGAPVLRGYPYATRS